MKALLTFALLLAAAGPPHSAPQFFTNTRDIAIAQPDRQNYFVVDRELWARARPDLADLRIYAGAREVPYKLVTEHGSTETQESEARIFNVGSAGGATEFTIDTSGAGEYNRVTLALDARDFISRATVDGLDPVQGSALRVGTFTVYDFTREQLGTNFMLKLPDSRFQYLRITLPGVAPRQVRGAKVAHYQETAPLWMDLGVRTSTSQLERKTVIAWEQPKHAPLDRVVLQVSRGNMNFRRAVTLFDAEGRTVAHGQVLRIHLERVGKVVDSENMALAVPDARSSSFKLVIENGDDLPLDVRGLQALSEERRVYFDPHGQTALRVYYGDQVLSAPAYDYATLSQEDVQAAPAQLEPGMHNADYRGRPDERPWSERHPAVLWIVLVIAVVVLGAVALRGLRA